MAYVFSSLHKNVIKLAQNLVISLKLQGQFYPEQGISGLVSSCSDSKSDCPTFLLQTFPAAASSPPNDFTPQTLLFFFKKKRESERGKPPRLSLFAVSAAGVAAPKRERERGWEVERGLERVGEGGRRSEECERVLNWEKQIDIKQNQPQNERGRNESLKETHMDDSGRNTRH